MTSAFQNRSANSRSQILNPHLSILCSICVIVKQYYQSRIKCPLFGGKKLKWSDANKHPTRSHTILKNSKAKNGERSSVFVFFSMVWGRVG